MLVRDEGGVFGAPLEAVWRFVGSGVGHSEAHAHRRVRRRIFTPSSGRYSWEQEFDGRNARFTMRWRAFVPVGVVYDVLDGPFTGSRFILYYTPRGRRTEVGIVGEFRSPTLPPKQIPAAVRRFFAREFEQDRRAIESVSARRLRRTGPPGRR